MTDRLYLSYWIPRYDGLRMRFLFEKALRAFPHSRLSAGYSQLRLQALSLAEPPLFERAYEPPFDPEAAIADWNEFATQDAAATLETSWDLWLPDDGWHLRPVRVQMLSFGPDFEAEQDEQIRIEFGPDEHFLAVPGDRLAFRPIQQNVQSLLKLTQDLDAALEPERRQLWSESGGNFADKLKQSLQ